MRKRQKLWRIVAKALGPKTGKNEKEADIIAFVRLIILFSYMMTNGFIIANAIRHWNDVPSQSLNANCIKQSSFN
jgi:hypothetical protein